MIGVNLVIYITLVSKGNYMAEEFLSDGLVETVGEKGDRQPIRIVLIGSRPAITSTIHRLHILDFAPANNCTKYVTR